ncbi:phenoloxidase-activating factor 2-like [Drosophila montana]|uniref:phenoloxidase-activating factor 2-like n=1 Tax=Drosophila montana TaxID=40370 RepID=UPI00313AB9CC
MECTPRYLCDDTNAVIKDGRALIDFRAAVFSRKDSQVCDWSEVCCSLADKRSIREKEYTTRGCGYSNPKGVRITIENADDNNSQFGQFPWMVAILNKNCSSSQCAYEVLGGGSLVAPNVVVTVAHIFNRASSASNLLVRAGEWDIQSMAEALPHEDRKVKTKLIHESFNVETGYNDIALLLLSTPFKLNEHIDIICLPGRQLFVDSSRCLVTGWGKRNLDDPGYPHILKKIEMPLVSDAKCQAQLRNTRLGPYYELHSSFVCAGGEKDKDACFGDGGAPLICPTSTQSTRYNLVGIVVGGVDCGNENVPGLYANIHMLQPWIEAKLNQFSITN